MEPLTIERGVTFPTWLVVFGNHNALCQLANQSRRACWKEDFVENEAFERGGA